MRPSQYFHLVTLLAGSCFVPSVMAQESGLAKATPGPTEAAQHGAVLADAAEAEVVNLKFGEMFRWPVGPRGLEPSEKLLRLNGRRVHMVGYMVEQEAMRSVILSPLPLKLGDEDESLADDVPPGVVFVRFALPDQIDLRYRPGLLQATGTLSVGSFVEADGRTSSVRLTLDSSRSRESIHDVQD